MAYTNITFANLKSKAHARLGNSAFWSTTELGLYINEAIRIWNILTLGGVSGSVTSSFNTVNGTEWYATNQAPGTIIQVEDIINEMQYHCLEPPNLGVSMASDLWTVDEWIDYLKYNHETFVNLTHCHNKKFTGTIGGGGITWKNSEVEAMLVLGKEVQKTDRFVLDHVLTNLETTGTPLYYMVAPPKAPDSLAVFPPPASSQAYVIYAPDPPALSSLSTYFTIVDDLVPYIKWAALGNAFAKQGQAWDPIKAKYGTMRFAEGLKAAAMQTHTLALDIAGKPLQKTSLNGLLNGFPTWWSSRDEPTTFVPLGWNAVILSPIPDGIYSVVVQGQLVAAIMTADGDYLNMADWEVNALLDYAEHIAMFKKGGDEFQASMDLYEKFIIAAEQRNKYLDWSGQFRQYIGGSIGKESLGAPAARPNQ